MRMTWQQIEDENPTVSKEEAVREVEKHCVNVGEFFAECGEHNTYKSLAVLIWLGY